MEGDAWLLNAQARAARSDALVELEASPPLMLFSQQPRPARESRQRRSMNGGRRLASERTGACSKQRARAAQAGPASTRPGRGRRRGARARARRKRMAEPARAAEQRGKSSGGPPPACCTSWGSGGGVRRISRSRASRLAVRGVRLGCRTWALRARCADNEGCAREISCMISTKSRRRRDTATLFHALLPWLVTLQAAV
jgi:hypothetical protein